MATPDPEVEAIEVQLLLEAIHQRYGFDLREYAPATMRRRLKAVLARSGIPHLGELQHRLLADPQLFAGIVDDLTVQVSDMFRDPAVYRTFRDRVVPVLRTYPLVKIWHAGCAAGEEVYATAILLEEEGLADRVQIYATDLSPRAVARAREGVYEASRLSTFAQNHRESGGTNDFAVYHAPPAYDRIAMKERLRNNVVFFQHDLVSDHAFGEMQVVFCRNVLIYFGAGLRQRVLRKIEQGLCAGGFLCLGSSERITPEPGFADFAPEDRIYRWWSAP